MIDEVYDIFNDAWEKIGMATWTEVHARGLLHENATIMIFKDVTKNEFLVQHRGSGMAHDPGKLTNSAGGHLLAGMSADEGARKELQEELFAGHELPNISLTKIKTFLNEDFPGNREILNVYEGVYPGPFYFEEKELEHPPEWMLWDDLITDLRAQPEKYTQVLKNILKEAYHISLN